MGTDRPARSGRQARQAERATRGGVIGRPYILRNIPTYDVLSEENLLRIEAAADRILAETGIDFRDDPEALALWRKAGAQVDGIRVRFEPGLLREVLRTAPPVFTQHARNPARSVQIGGRSVVFAPAYGSPFVMDLDGGGALARWRISATSSASRRPRPTSIIPAARSASPPISRSTSAISTWCWRI